MKNNNRKYTIEEVRKDFEEKEYTLISTEYKDRDSKLDYICNKHKELGIQQTTYNLIKTRKNNCELCKKEARWSVNVFTYIRNGYVMLYLPGHHMADSLGYVYEHRYEAEKMLGRKLLDTECIHHKDENRSNNKHENLMVFKTVADHTAFHQGCNIELDGDVWVALHDIVYVKRNAVNLCPICKIKYKAYDAKMCLECHNKEISKHIPSKEELEKLIYTHTFVELGRKFNVSSNTIKKWCKKYGLPFRKKDMNTN